MKEILEFLRRLAANNDREWFAEHKEEYRDVKTKVDALTTELMARMMPFEPDVARLSVADCTYRIYRDTRFSLDKTPFKTHIGIFINPPFGKKSERLGYYLHIEPGQSFACAGTICLPTKTLTAIRESIRDNIDEYLEIINNPGFKSLYPVVGMNMLKTAPKGFARDWEYIDLVRPRDFAVEHKLSDRQMCEKSLADRVVDCFHAAKPWVDFINFAIDEM